MPGPFDPGYGGNGTPGSNGGAAPGTPGNNMPSGSGGATMGGFGGLAQGLGIASSYQANAPNQGAYAGLAGQAGANQAKYQNQADAAQNRTGPQINNPFQQQSQQGLAGNQAQYQGLMGQLNKDINDPQDSMAVNQLQHGTDQGIQAQMAMAHSANGGAVAQAGAARAAQQQGVQTQAAVNSQAAQLAEENRFNAINAANQVNTNSGALGMQQYGLEQQNAQQQAQFDQNQGKINNDYSLGLDNAGNQQGALQLNAVNGSTNAIGDANGINAKTASDASAAGGKLFGGATDAAGSLLQAAPALLSDPLAKKDMHPDMDHVDAFLRHAAPNSFKYKRAVDEPTAAPTGGTYIGVSADSIASTPDIGPQLVEQGADGMKRLKALPAISAVMAGLGRVTQRLAALEHHNDGVHGQPYPPREMA